MVEFLSINPEVNHELKKLKYWFEINKLTLNVTKSSYIIFKGNKPDLQHDDLIFGNHKLNQVNSLTHLGIIIDAKLSWHLHTQYLTKKIASSIYVLRKIKHKINFITSIKLYDTLIASHLLYCNLVWGSTFKSYLDPIIKLQKKPYVYV